MRLLHAAVLIAGLSATEPPPASRSSFDALRFITARLSGTLEPDVVARVRAQAQTLADDCKGTERPTMPSAGQYIYNALYTWAYTSEGSRHCVHLLLPEYRLLSREEAYDLLLASSMKFPPPTGYVLAPPPPPPPGTEVVPRRMHDNMPVLILP
jgi:hypothetical protein